MRDLFRLRAAGLALAALVGAIMLSVLPAIAVVTPVTSVVDTPDCDPLVMPSLVDELGQFGSFPPDESISSSRTFNGTTTTACPTAQDFPFIINELISIRNLTPTAFTDLWYVADLNTLIYNFDGTVNGGYAFKIDAVGINAPLVSEVGGSLPGVFEPNETWQFILQDYSNNLSGVSAHDFGAIGIASNDCCASSGSIIAIPVGPVPEPSTALLCGLGLVGLAARRMRRDSELPHRSQGSFRPMASASPTASTST